jgi:hypothetical protein
MSAVGQTIPTTPYNPYLEDTTNIANNGAAYFPPQPAYTAPAQPVSTHERYSEPSVNVRSFNIIYMLLLVPTERIS